MIQCSVSAVNIDTGGKRHVAGGEHVQYVGDVCKAAGRLVDQRRETERLKARHSCTSIDQSSWLPGQFTSRRQ